MSCGISIPIRERTVGATSRRFSPSRRSQHYATPSNARGFAPLADPKPVVVEKFADFRQVVQRAANGRFFAQIIDGRTAGLCELYLVDGLAQVEHVDTLEEFRGRGIARNVVLRAVQEARTAGADLIVISADLNDWPIELYRRLGFDEIGRVWAFTKPLPA